MLNQIWKASLRLGLLTLLSTGFSIGLVPAIDRFSSVSAQETNPAIDDRKVEADRLLQQGIELYNRSQFQAALQAWETALELYQAIDDVQGEARSVNNLGLIYYFLGEYRSAIDFYQQSLELFRTIEDVQGEANSLMNLGNAFASLGEYRAAIDYHQQSLELFRTIEDAQGEANSLGNLGNAHYFLSEYCTAIDYHQQSLEIFRAIDNVRGEANSLMHLGLAYASLGEYRTAIDYHRQSLEIFRTIDDVRGEANSSGNLGLAYESLGEYRTAIEFYQQSLELSRASDDVQGKARSLSNLGNAYLYLGEYRTAIDHHQQSLEIFRAIGDVRGEANSLSNLGNAYHSLGEYPTAIEFYQQSLEISRAIDDVQGEANFLNNLGSTYHSLGEYPTAIDSLEQALAISQQIGDIAGEGRTLGNLGNLYQLQGEDNLAIAFLKASVSVREEIRAGIQALPQTVQQSYIDTVADTYRRLADLLLARGDVLDAQYVLELLKIEELQEFTRSRVLSVDDRTYELNPTEDTVIETHGSLVALGLSAQQCRTDPNCNDAEWKEIDDRVQSLEAEFNTAVDILEAEVQARYEQDSDRLNPDQFTGTAAEIVAIPGTVLIYPVVLQEKLWILWGTSGVTNAIEVPVTQETIGAAVLEFRQLMEVCETRACTSEDITAVQATAQTLYGYLIPPQLETEIDALRAMLPDGQVPNLVFALDRVTRYVPMAALFDGETYLIENHTVSTILSAETFSQDYPLSEIPNPQALALGLSNAVPDYGFPYPLENVPVELDAVNALYPGVRLLNNEFDTDAFRQRAAYQILHIATHGVFEPNQNDASFLMLGTGEPITIAELETYKSRFAEFSLVVLSACESALSKPDQSGLEIASIASVFIDAQVDTVVASLWQVNDISTSQLMQQFYGNLAAETDDRITVSQALRDAQLQLIQSEFSEISQNRAEIPSSIVFVPNPDSDRARSTQPNYAHPYYWAPFVIIGNGL